MAEQLMNFTDRDKEELDREIRRTLQKYFTKFGQVSAVEDLDKLDQLESVL